MREFTVTKFPDLKNNSIFRHKIAKFEYFAKKIYIRSFPTKNQKGRCYRDQNDIYTFEKLHQAIPTRKK